MGDAAGSDPHVVDGVSTRARAASSAGRVASNPSWISLTAASTARAAVGGGVGRLRRGDDLPPEQSAGGERAGEGEQVGRGRVGAAGRSGAERRVGARREVGTGP